MKKFLIVAILVIGALTAVMLGRTAVFKAETFSSPAAEHYSLAADAPIRRLAGALRIPTVVYAEEARIDWSAFDAFHDYLAMQFPSAHAALTLEKINRHGLLYTWPGRDSHLPPILLLAHQDVVPALPETLSEWRHPPFSGAVVDGYVWGRGALDDKSSLMAILESVELLLDQGFQPRRTVYLAFGQDEEVGGVRGATQLAETLYRRGVRPLFVLDEGGIVAEGMIPGVENPVALVGVAEKGIVDLTLVAEGEGGHSSMPPRHTATGLVSRAIAKLEDRPFPADTRYIADLMRHLSHELPLPQRVVFANRWLFNPVIKKKLSGSRQLNAMIRTTTAATVIQGSVKSNVLPDEARAVVNFRILPGETAETVRARVERTIGDPRVQVRMDKASDPSPVSQTDTPSFAAVREAAHQALGQPDMVVSPYLTVGATDARHYTDLSDQVYRFLPIVVGGEELKGMHGVNERISIENYLNMIRFYRQLLLNAESL